MAVYLANMIACCPARTTVLRIEAITLDDARGKALRHCNKGPFRKDWKVSNIRAVPVTKTAVS